MATKRQPRTPKPNKFITPEAVTPAPEPVETATMATEAPQQAVEATVAVTGLQGGSPSVSVSTVTVAEEPVTRRPRHLRKAQEIHDPKNPEMHVHLAKNDDGRIEELIDQGYVLAKPSDLAQHNGKSKDGRVYFGRRMDNVAMIKPIREVESARAERRMAQTDTMAAHEQETSGSGFYQDEGHGTKTSGGKFYAVGIDLKKN